MGDVLQTLDRRLRQLFYLIRGHVPEGVVLARSASAVSSGRLHSGGTVIAGFPHGHVLLLDLSSTNRPGLLSMTSHSVRTELLFVQPSAMFARGRRCIGSGGRSRCRKLEVPIEELDQMSAASLLDGGRTRSVPVVGRLGIPRLVAASIRSAMERRRKDGAEILGKVFVGGKIRVVLSQMVAHAATWGCLRDIHR